MAELSVRIIQTGSVGVDKAVPNRSVSQNSLAYTGLFRSKKNHIEIPVKCFLVTHGQEKILIDAGWDTNVRKHPLRTITFPMWFASKPILKEGEGVDEQLEKLNIRSEDLSYVIMTHLDIDHDSGLRLVKKAPHILASKEEIKAAYSHQIRYVRRPLRGIDLEEIKWDGTYGPYQKSWDVFKDRSTVVFFTPGHSAGSISVKVQKGDDFILIVGDSGYNQESYEKLNVPGPVYSKEEMIKTLQWLNKMRLDSYCKGLLCAHDPSQETKPHLIEL